MAKVGEPKSGKADTAKNKDPAENKDPAGSSVATQKKPEGHIDLSQNRIVISSNPQRKAVIEPLWGTDVPLRQSGPPAGGPSPPYSRQDPLTQKKDAAAPPAVPPS